MNEYPKEVKEFYDSLESIKSLNIWNIQRELQTSERIESSDKNVIIERKCLLFNLDKGKLFSNVQITNIKGEIENKIDFYEDEIKYLIERIKETNNSWLKSRYSHILWQITNHKKYAEIAIENYIQTVTAIKAEEVRELSIFLSAIFYISKKTKIKQSECKDFAFALFEELPNWLKANIVKDILDLNFFQNDELKQVSDKITTWIDLNNPDFYFSNKTNLEIALKLYDKIKKPKEILYKYLAENENLLLSQSEDDENFFKITTVGNKAFYLKKAKDLVNYEITLKEYTRLKQKVKLKKISVTLDDEKTKLFNDYLTKRSKIILKQPTESILAFFCENENILVNPEFNKKNAEERIKKSLHNLFTITSFDINTNHKILTQKDKLQNEIITSYIISHNIHCYSLFLKVFVDGIIMGKLNYYKVLEFLKTHTWFGQKFKRSISDSDKNEDSNWISLLAPGIHNLFSQFELSVLLNTNKINNFILSIDSLTIKFEGALRDFILLSGGTTTKEFKNDLKEQLLEELLENSKIKEYFSESDIELFKTTFTNRGRNIRNNVAHSFMEYYDYNLQVAVLVFFCILRLGKYNFNEK